MRILLFTFSFPPAIGGAEALSERLARYMHAAGHEVVVATPHRAGAEKSDAVHPYPVRRISKHIANADPIWRKAGQKMRLAWDLRQLAVEFRPEIVLTTSWDPCGYLAAILMPRGVPYVVMGLGTELTLLPRRGVERAIKTRMRRLAFGRASRIIAISRYTAQRIAEIVPEQAGRVSIIRCGIDREQIDPDPARPREVGSAPRLVTVCRLVERKGVDTVIRAIPLLTGKYPDLEYRIVGGGKQKSKLEALAAELGVSAHVRFYGPVGEEQKAGLYRDSDLFVMTPRERAGDFEGFGIVYLEAMARGLPAVGSTSGGIPDAVEHAVTGWLVPPEQPESLARVIDELLSNPGLRGRLTAAARQELDRRFTWPDIVADYLKVLADSTRR